MFHCFSKHEKMNQICPLKQFLIYTQKWEKGKGGAGGALRLLKHKHKHGIF
jgi:hypothetical protein